MPNRSQLRLFLTFSRSCRLYVKQAVINSETAVITNKTSRNYH